MITYLYKSPVHFSGLTRRSEKAYLRWRERGFVPQNLAIRSQKHKGHVEHRLVVHGTYQGRKVALRLNGGLWGYSGQGPRLTARILEDIGLDRELAFARPNVLTGGQDYSKAIQRVVVQPA